MYRVGNTAYEIFLPNVLFEFYQICKSNSHFKEMRTKEQIKLQHKEPIRQIQNVGDFAKNSSSSSKVHVLGVGGQRLKTQSNATHGHDWTLAQGKNSYKRHSQNNQGNWNIDSTVGIIELLLILLSIIMWIMKRNVLILRR